jgi:flavin-dependent dehydrogenase
LVTDKTDVLLRAPGYYMVDYGQAIRDLSRQLKKTSVEIFPRDADICVLDLGDAVSIEVDGQKRHSEVVVDCSGDSAVTSGDNPLTEFVYGGTFRGTLREKEMVIAFVGKIGGTCWANPSVQPGYIDVVVSAWGWRSDRRRFTLEGPTRLTVLRDFLKEKKVAIFENDRPEVTFSGSIRSQVADKPRRRRVYGAGDAAGMAIPKTGDGFRWAILGGELVAKAVAEGRPSSGAYQEFYRRRPIWKDRLLGAATLYRLEKQARGVLGTSVEPIKDILSAHPELVGMAEEFFVRENLQPRLLLHILANPHFREILLNSLGVQLKLALTVLSRVEPYYPFPPLEKD